MRQIERHAALCMARSMNHLGLKSSPAKNVALLQQLIHFGEVRRVHAEECGLLVHRLVKRQVVAVHQHRRAGVLMEFAQAADVIYMRMRANDDLYNELMTPEKIQD